MLRAREVILFFITVVIIDTITVIEAFDGSMLYKRVVAFATTATTLNCYTSPPSWSFEGNLSRISHAIATWHFLCICPLFNHMIVPLVRPRDEYRFPSPFLVSPKFSRR